MSTNLRRFTSGIEVQVLRWSPCGRRLFAAFESVFCALVLQHMFGCNFIVLVSTPLGIAQCCENMFFLENAGGISHLPLFLLPFHPPLHFAWTATSTCRYGRRRRGRPSTLAYKPAPAQLLVSLFMAQHISALKNFLMRMSAWTPDGQALFVAFSPANGEDARCLVYYCPRNGLPHAPQVL